MAVRVAQTAAELSHAMREVAAYERLGSVHGQPLPRLIAHVFTLDGEGYFTAADFLEVCALLILTLVCGKHVSRSVHVLLNSVSPARTLNMWLAVFVPPQEV